jgi:hypothetical protein
MYAGKDVENRARSFPRRRDGFEVTGRVWIHCSLWPGRVGTVASLDAFNSGMLDMSLTAEDAGIDGGRDLWRAADVSQQAWSWRGHIVGSIEVYGYQMPEPNPPKSPWYVPGSLAIMVRDPKPLARPVPAKGALGWWAVPDGLIAALDKPKETP